MVAVTDADVWPSNVCASHNKKLVIIIIGLRKLGYCRCHLTFCSVTHCTFFRGLTFPYLIFAPTMSRAKHHPNLCISHSHKIHNSLNHIPSFCCPRHRLSTTHWNQWTTPTLITSSFSYTPHIHNNPFCVTRVCCKNPCCNHIATLSPALLNRHHKPFGCESPTTNAFSSKSWQMVTHITSDHTNAWESTLMEPNTCALGYVLVPHPKQTELRHIHSLVNLLEQTCTIHLCTSTRLRRLGTVVNCRWHVHVLRWKADFDFWVVDIWILSFSAWCH